MMNKLLIVLSSLMIISCGEVDSKNSSSTGGTGGGSSTIPVNNNVFSLSWTPPGMYENNDILSPVTDLSEYRIYYGDSANNVTQNVAIVAANKSSVSTAHLDAQIISTYATVSVAMTAVSKDGVESGLSQIVTFNP